MAEQKPDTKKLAQARSGLAVKGGTSGRLLSFRKQRDLTLGGAQKRTYTPTIPVRRIKEEPKDTVSEQKPKRERGQTRQRGRSQERGRGRGRGRGQPNIIQSKSIFSEGLAPKEGSASGPKDVGGGGGGGFSRNSKSVTPKLKENFDPATDTSKILDLVKHDGEIKMDQDQLECGMLPIHIPLSFHDRFVKKVDDADISTVKSEPMDTDNTVEPMDTDQKKPFVNPPTVVSKTQDEQMSCARLLTSDDARNKEQMLLFQLPDILPTKLFENAGVEGSSSKSSDQAPKLQDISEGYIGKIQVHKSGKTRLILGGVALDISMGTPCNFLQDVVSIHPEEGQKSMMTLGHIKHRLVCTPDFEELLKNSNDVT